MNVISLDQRIRIIAALVEGNSIRSTERLTGVHRDTVMRLGVQVGEACARLHDARVRDLYSHCIELDEIWSFVAVKQGHLDADEDDSFVGDQYTFVALDATAKLAISYLTGKRSRANTDAFARDLRARVVGAPQINTDGFNAYPDALEAAFGTQHHHGVAVKVYEYEGEGVPEHRYAPGRVIAVERVRRAGNPDEAKISTSYVERGNLTMRMAMRRFTRLTNGFSKRLRNLRAAVSLHFAHYNFVRVHETLRTTPAMAAELTDHVWSLAELLETAGAESDNTDPVATVSATGRPRTT